MKKKSVPRFLAASLLLAAISSSASAREWSFTGIPQPMEAEFVAMANGGVVLQGPNGKSFEVPLANFAPADQKYLRALQANGGKEPPPESGKPIGSRTAYSSKSVATLADRSVALDGPMELHITGTGDPVVASTFQFTSPDAWLFFDNIRPSEVIANFLPRMRVNGSKASLGRNLRVAAYAAGSVVIPQGDDFPAMTVYADKSLAGQSKELSIHKEIGGAQLGILKSSISSFVLKRGYMATIASGENGSGPSRNYVAQDHDVIVNALPAELDDAVRFIRIFPWRWTGKKGIAGGIGKPLAVDWFYDWNISTNSSPDVEYVPIAQKVGWPNLKQDWAARGSLHLLGFNEPDHKDQADLSVDAALKAWPSLMASGLRLGSPAPSDGGLGWLYDFVKKADAANMRVDFIAVHYYRAVADPGDAKGAAAQFYRFLKEIHDRTGRPIWVTEWNNGANWTKAPDPNEKQQKAAIAAMIQMLDETPFVERYALYNWVEDCRMVSRKDNSLTPAGEVYRDQKSPVAFTQPKSAK